MKVTSFWEKLLEKIQNSHFWPFRISSDFFGKNCWKKFRMVRNGNSEFVPTIFPKKMGKNTKWPKLGILNLFKPFWR